MPTCISVSKKVNEKYSSGSNAQEKYSYYWISLKNLKKLKILWSEYHAPIPVTGISSHLFWEVSLNSNHELRAQRNSVCIYVDQV